MSRLVVTFESGWSLWVEGCPLGVLAVIDCLSCMGAHTHDADTPQREWQHARGLRTAPHLWLLVGVSGLEERIAEIRRISPRLPVYVVGTHGSPATEELRALRAGADGYSGAPLVPAIFSARIDAILRRGSGTYKVSDGAAVVLDVQARTLQTDGCEFTFSPREFALIVYLHQRYGHWVPRDELFRQVFDTSVRYDSSLVRTHILNIRKKLGVHASILHTDRDLGVRLEREEAPAARAR